MPLSNDNHIEQKSGGWGRKVFRMNALRTKDILHKLIENTEKSLTITGYSVSDYFTDMLDAIIRKSQQGIYVSMYINDIEKQKNALDRLMAYQSRFLHVYEYQKHEDDKMAALHAKLLVSDAKASLISSANLSYHGIQGNVEMGFLIEFPSARLNPPPFRRSSFSGISFQ